MLTLNNWYTHAQGDFLSREPDPFQAPETQQVCVGISGIVNGHPELKDGSHITTSRPMDVYEEDGKTFLRTYSGSVYELLEPNEDYANFIPKAKERLIDTFKRMKENV